MGEDRIDFSGLDPTRDRERFEGVVRSIMAAAAPELISRHGRSSLLAQLVQLRKPMLAAATVAAIVSAGVLMRVRIPETAGSTDGIAEALGVPSVLALGVHNERVPTFSELFVAFEEDR